jgi:DNA-binding NtrC family response regulator
VSTTSPTSCLRCGGLFRGKGFQVRIAEGGKAGLALLETETVDLVISDMRMPEMDGAQFLEQVRARWPETLRLLLTGYSDVTSIIEAINRGEIYRYITKPWDDNDIVMIVRQALERMALELEKSGSKPWRLRSTRNCWPSMPAWSPKCRRARRSCRLPTSSSRAALSPRSRFSPR